MYFGDKESLRLVNDFCKINMGHQIINEYHRSTIVQLRFPRRYYILKTSQFQLPAAAAHAPDGLDEPFLGQLH